MSHLLYDQDERSLGKTRSQEEIEDRLKKAQEELEIAQRNSTLAELEEHGINDWDEAPQDHIWALSGLMEETRSLEPRSKQLSSLLERSDSMMKEVKEKLDQAREVAINITSLSDRGNS